MQYRHTSEIIHHRLLKPRAAASQPSSTTTSSSSRSSSSASVTSLCALLLLLLLLTPTRSVAGTPPPPPPPPWFSIHYLHSTTSRQHCKQLINISKRRHTVHAVAKELFKNYSRKLHYIWLQSRPTHVKNGQSQKTNI